MAERARAVCLDVAAPADAFAAAGLPAGAADQVLMNPPFNAAHNPSPDRSRRLAYVAAHDTLVRWIEAAARLLRPAGVVTLIWRADGLAAVLDALAGNFGAVTVLPVHPKPDAPAIRVIVRAVKAKPRGAHTVAGFDSRRCKRTADGGSGGRVARRRAAAFSKRLKSVRWISDARGDGVR